MQLGNRPGERRGDVHQRLGGLNLAGRLGVVGGGAGLEEARRRRWPLGGPTEIGEKELTHHRYGATYPSLQRRIGSAAAPFCIGVAIPALERLTVTNVNALHRARVRLDVAGAAGTHREAPHMDPALTKGG